MSAMGPGGKGRLSLWAGAKGWMLQVGKGEGGRAGGGVWGFGSSVCRQAELPGFYSPSELTLFSGTEQKEQSVSERLLTFPAAPYDEEDKGQQQQCQQDPSKKGQEQVLYAVWAKGGMVNHWTFWRPLRKARGHLSHLRRSP